MSLGATRLKRQLQETGWLTSLDSMTYVVSVINVGASLEAIDLLLGAGICSRGQVFPGDGLFLALCIPLLDVIDVGWIHGVLSE